ncbi:MAG: hypothetical protein V5A64_02140 [Candidatus Thermoplasmatota archaeon]
MDREKMKNKKIIIWVIASIMLVIAITFAYIFLAFSYEYSTTISVEQLDSKPEQYINMTEEQLNQRPFLKQAYQSKSYIEIPYEKQDQLQEIKDFFIERGTFNFKVNNSYYKISFTST